MSKSIAIIGAGMAGLSCAMALGRRGYRPVLFDKGRGPGGRMATRRAEVDGETVHFDHGAQYFTARDPRFVEAVVGWQSAGFVQHWEAAGADAYVGTPTMNAPLKQMAQFWNVMWDTKVDGILRDDRGWHLRSGDTIFRAQTLVCAVPAEQAAELLARSAPDLAAKVAQVRSRPCWALMVRFADRLDLSDVVKGSTISWAARNSAKPARGEGEDWVIHASPEWSQEHIDLDAGQVAEKLLDAFAQETGAALPATQHQAAHRWRYAMAETSDGPPAMWDAKLQLGLCGDWLIGPRIESAFLSGCELAELIDG